jgi:hypothetical protein
MEEGSFSAARRSGERPLSGSIARVREFLRGHPVVCLLLLAPEVEYLTGSSRLSDLVAQPILFLLFLAQNLASYGAAVLLIREARVRWNLGWAGVLFLGACYGIINEGLGVSTLFRTQATGVGLPGVYGHFLGVNWLNVTSLIAIVHPLLSVAIPILFLDLALPETRNRPLLDRPEIGIAFYALVTDTIATCFFVYRVTGFAAGPILWATCLGTMGVLVLAARFAPKYLLHPTTVEPRLRPFAFALLGGAFLWILGLVQAVLVHFAVPPPLVMAWLLGFAGLTLLVVLWNIGRTHSEPQVVALAGGLVLSLIPMGLSTQFATGPGLIPLLGGDLVAVLFVLYLWRKYRLVDLHATKASKEPARAAA